MRISTRSAKSGDPDAAYWYRLNSADLRPPELS